MLKLVDIGIYAYRAGRYNEARTLFELACQQEQRVKSLAKYYLAMTYQKCGMPEKARKIFQLFEGTRNSCSDVIDIHSRRLRDAQTLCSLN
jgi:hypothetical protein